MGTVLCQERAEWPGRRVRVGRERERDKKVQGCWQQWAGRSPGEGNGNPLLRIPWMEEPGRLQSMGSQRVRHD